MIMSKAKEWKEIKTGTRRIRKVCGDMLPQRRGVACLAKVQKFESDLNKIVKKPNRAYGKKYEKLW